MERGSLTRKAARMIRQSKDNRDYNYELKGFSHHSAMDIKDIETSFRVDIKDAHTLGSNRRQSGYIVLYKSPLYKYNKENKQSKLRLPNNWFVDQGN